MPFIHKSENKCPFCGGKKWECFGIGPKAGANPLSEENREEAAALSKDEMVGNVPLIDWPADAAWGDNGNCPHLWVDMCSSCGAFLVG